MGVINIYNSLDNTKEVINGCGKLSDLIPTYYDLDNCVIIKAGEKITEDYEVTADDVVFVRKVPGDPVSIVIGATTVVCTLLLGGTLGLTLMAKEKWENQQLQEQAQRDAQNLAQQIDQLPFIKGAKNSSALGKQIQYLIGKCYNTPYLITDGFYSIGGTNGSEQYYNAVLSLGYGKQKVTEVMLGDSTLLENADGITEGVHNVDESSVYYDAEDIIELRQNGADFTTDIFNYKHIVTQDGSEIKHDYGEDAEELIKQVADYTKKLEVCIQFNGLRQYNSKKSTWVTRKAIIRPYWSNDDGETWNEFYFDGMTDNTIELNTKTTVRFIATKEFTFNEVDGKSILLKLVKETPALESNSNETCYLQYYQSLCYDNEKSTETTGLVSCQNLEDDFINKTTRIGIRLTANDNTSGSLDEIHVISEGFGKTWDNDAQTWSDEKTATNNPASEILEILTSDVHTHSKLSENEIDLLKLGELYKFCEDNSLTCNSIITTEKKKKDIISSILEYCGASMYFDASEGLWTFAIDYIENNPVALLNSENLKSINYVKDFSRQIDGYKVTFTDEESWQTNTIYVMRNNQSRTQDSVISELALDYVTNKDHAYKIAQRKLRQLYLQPRTITVGVGREGDYYPLYSTVLMQNKELRQGLLSTVINGFIYDDEQNITGYKVQDLIPWDSSKTFGAVIHAVSSSGNKIYYRQITKGDTDREIILSESITDDIQPQLFNIVSIGYLDDEGEFTTITNQMKIVGIEPDGNASLKLTLKDYNAAIYDVGEIPEYKSNITRPPVAYRDIPTVQKVESIKGEKGDAGQNGADAFNYLGVINSADELPVSNNGDYFLCGTSFNLDGTIDANGKTLNVNGKMLSVHKKFTPGFIYYSTSNYGWRIVTNRNNYRYIVATNDLISMSKEISPNLAAAVKQTSGAESYLGAFDSAPENPELNNYFLYTGETVTNFTNGRIYQWNGSKWNALDNISAKSYTYFMTALKDMMANNITTEVGAFATLFCQTLAVQDAMIESLNAKFVTLREKGYFKSENWNGTMDSDNKISEYGTEGVAFDSEGNGDLVNVNISGSVSAKELSIKNLEPGDVVLRNFESINSGKYSEGYTQICGSGVIRVAITLKELSYLSLSDAVAIVDNPDISTSSQTLQFTELNQTLYADIPINEGQNIHFKLAYFPGGVVDSTMTVDIKICTDHSNGVLSYLGSYSFTKTKISPSR